MQMSLTAHRPNQSVRSETAREQRSIWRTEPAQPRAERAIDTKTRPFAIAATSTGLGSRYVSNGSTTGTVSFGATPSGSRIDTVLSPEFATRSLDPPGESEIPTGDFPVGIGFSQES